MPSIELIVYLEPTHSSSLWKTVNEFIHSTTNQFYTTTASRYSCHATMTGFFKVESQDPIAAIKHISNILENVQSYFKKGFARAETRATVVKSTGHHLDQVKGHLLLPVTASSHYHQGIKAFAEQCKEYGIHVRTKPINHISLAYWDEPGVPEHKNEEWQRLITKEHLLERMESVVNGMLKEVSNPADWDIVLYERVVKGNAIGEMHQFVECMRCKVVNEDENSDS
ncbi:hypothetical protein CLU79DRAFT_832370 [Phycomyces nitens]|nr:hypothetical protein CLU79DRAFT_832370 [Phycomyces nitens]